MNFSAFLKRSKEQKRNLKQEAFSKDAKIFAVTGFSGSGKTSAVDAIENHLKNQGKKVMRITCEKYFLPFGFSSLKNFGLFIKRIRTFSHAIDRLKKDSSYMDDYNDAMSKFVNKKVLQKLAASEGFDAYLIEGIQLPDDIWQNADCKLYVNADLEKRSKAVRERPKDGKWTKDDNLAEQRQLEQIKFNQSAKQSATHTIFNEHNGFEKLNKDAVNICNEVLKMNRIQRPR